jgi:hypothetical protein
VLVCEFTADPEKWVRVSCVRLRISNNHSGGKHQTISEEDLNARSPEKHSLIAICERRSALSAQGDLLEGEEQCVNLDRSCSEGAISGTSTSTIWCGLNGPQIEQLRQAKTLESITAIDWWKLTTL